MQSLKGEVMYTDPKLHEVRHGFERPRFPADADSLRRMQDVINSPVAVVNDPRPSILAPAVAVSVVVAVAFGIFLFFGS
jgi:hypothetical protein